MAKRTIVNGVTDEQIVFGEYGEDEDGSYLRFEEVRLPPGGQGPPEHRHLRGAEHIEVVEGQLGIEVEGKEQVLEPGDSITIPAGTRHSWGNAGDSTMRWQGTLREPDRFEELVTSFFALANKGRVDESGEPSLLQAAVCLAEYRDEYDPVFLPGPAKWMAFNVLAPIGRALGYRTVHEYVPPAANTAEDSTATP